MSTDNGERYASLHADRPKETKADDALGRDKFAASIAGQIRRAPRHHSFVVGLVGPWGSGKTTILNFIKEELASEASLLFLSFNPWLFSGHKELVAHFFHEIAAQIRDEDRGEWRDIWRGFEGYSRLLRPLRAVPGVDSDRSGAAYEPSLTRQRKLLEDALAKAKQRLVIVIDDVDRLDDEEIRDVMRLVRLLADFPNTIYVLAYDQKRVVEALGKGKRGRAYLEKIVQVVHQVPPFREWRVTDILETAIGELLSEVGLSQPTPDFRYGSLRKIQPLFRGFRDIYRYLNALQPTLSAVGDEVHVEDVCALEALRILAPNVFDSIVQHSGLFVEIRSYDSKYEEDRRNKVLEIFKSWGEIGTICIPICKSLFPRVSNVGGGPSFNNSRAYARQWRRECRVAHVERLNIYLDRALPPETVSSHTLRQFFQCIQSEASLRALLNVLTPGEFDDLLGRLRDYEDQLEVDEQCTAMKVLVWRIQQAFEPAEMCPGGATAGRYANAITPILCRITVPKRLVLVEREMASATSLSARNLIILALSRDSLLDPPSMDKIGCELALVVLAESVEKLAIEQQLGFLMALAKTCSEDQTRSKWRELFADDRHALMTLSNLLCVGLSHRSHTIPWWEELEQAIGKEQIIERVRQLSAKRDELGLDERATLALDVALQYPKGGVGKPLTTAEVTSTNSSGAQDDGDQFETDSADKPTPIPESTPPD